MKEIKIKCKKSHFHHERGLTLSCQSFLAINCDASVRNTLKRKKSLKVSR